LSYREADSRYFFPCFMSLLVVQAAVAGLPLVCC
jgi:hypothetical protein